jgi:glucokinase
VKVLAGDIGGTKTSLAIVDVGTDSVAVELNERYDSRKYAGLAPIIHAFVEKTSAKFERASFGIAGPVIDNRCEATNLPWVVDGNDVARELNIGSALLVNDFVAAAYGVLRMTDADLVMINPGERIPRAPIAVLGAGTGLGEAILVHTGQHYEVVSSEGGHADFAPRDEVQDGLLRFLRKRHGRVSYERVVSGKLGIPSIYEYLRDSGIARESDAMREALARGEDLGALVGTHALAGTDALSQATVELFVSAYGAEAGNLALKVIARAGVFVCGGIAPKILPRMTDGVFRRAFVDKGRLSHLVEGIPVHVVTHPHVGLVGAAVAGAR